MYEKFWDNITEIVFAERQPEKSDIIMIPGNGYPQMAEEAALLWKKGYGQWILPSGKYSIEAGSFSGVQEKQELYSGEYQTEWEFLKAVLVKNGVSPSAVLREDQAMHTYDNAICSREVTDRLGLTIRSAIICCKNYHARRCLMYYQLIYPNTEFYVVPSVTDHITRDNWQQSLKGRKLVMGEMERLGWQFHKIAEKLGEEEKRMKDR